MGRRHKDTLAYIFIAMAIFIIIRALTLWQSRPIVQVLLYIFISISLLASNVPRVLDIPIHYVYAIKRIEYFSFCVAIICFFVTCMHYFFR